MKLEKSVDLPGQAPKKGFQVDTDLWVLWANEKACMSQRTNESMGAKYQLENQRKSKNISKHGVSEIEVLVWLHRYFVFIRHTNFWRPEANRIQFQ